MCAWPKLNRKYPVLFALGEGAELFATIRSYISTCIKQKQGVFEALQKAMQNDPILS